MAKRSKETRNKINNNGEKTRPEKKSRMRVTKEPPAIKVQRHMAIGEILANYDWRDTSSYDNAVDILLEGISKKEEEQLAKLIDKVVPDYGNHILRPTTKWQ